MENKKKLILITYDLSNSIHYRQELINFFGNSIEIETHTVTDGIGYNLNADAVLILSPVNTDELLLHFIDEPIIIHGLKAISAQGYWKLMEIMPKSKVLLMTTNRTSAFEMAAHLYQLGIDHIDFIPSYPNDPEIHNVDTAVTPEQVHFIPHYISNVINIGWRQISPDTLMSIMAALNIKNEHLLEKLYSISNDILSSNFSNTPLDLFSNTKELLHMTINLIDDGLLFLNTSNKPVFVNDAFLSMLGFRNQFFDTHNILQLLPSSLTNLILDENEKDNYILHLKEKELIFAFSKRFFNFYKMKKGCIIILKDAKKIENLEHEIRKKSVRNNDYAKYEFSDIIGNSPAIKDCIRRTKRMALTGLPILITGETGTGKELLAQSIHQYSPRYERPFIAINCASLSEELLESELFGYEDGAFTGAKKGGKKGLFELAQNGTIFLDEIGEMAFPLQSKLLRVLQEDEIRRIGGSTMIPIDVRIIAATNRDLNYMMEEGRFRMDLFYRISMFSIVVPPLRERPEDILILGEHFLSSASTNHHLSEDLKKMLLSYQWKGNIRELKNCINYMSYMSFGELTPEDLPPGYSKVPKEKLSISETSIISEASEVMELSQEVSDFFPDLFKRQQELCISVITLLYECPMGRNRIMRELEYNFTEHEVKKCLSYLKEKGYLLISRGRQGTCLSEDGKRIAKFISKR